ncbi:MAG: TonB-dependent receptor [Gemmatimonadaceae bacterium]
MSKPSIVSRQFVVRKFGFRRLVIAVSLGVLAQMCLPQAGLAQGAAIAGLVTDDAGAPVPGAAVRVNAAGSGESGRAVTDRTGRFAFSPLSAGNYTITIAMLGFRPLSVEAVNASDAGSSDLRLALRRRDVLETVVVTGTRSEQEIGKIASAVSVISGDDIRKGQRVSTLEESLKRVAGMRVEDELGGNGSRVRIIMRGTGTRANSPAGSGVRGVKVMVDGIPKNNAGGSAQDLTNIDLQSAKRIEVLKGPSSVLYGNQSGGVVNILTEDAPLNSSVAYRQTVGAYGLFKEHLKGGARFGRLGLTGSVYRNDQDGYRVRSKFHNTGFHSKLKLEPDSRSDLALIVDFDNNYQQSPGPLTEARFASNPRQADPTFLTNAVYSVVKELRVGASYHRELFGQDNLEAIGYVIPRWLEPFQQIGVFIKQYFVNRGMSTRYLNSRPLGGNANRFTVGVEYQNTPIRTTTTSRTTNKVTSDLNEHANTAGAYVLEELSILPDLTLTAGGRYDYVHFQSENFALSSPEVGRIFRKFTPKVGFAYQPVPAFSMYGNISRGFETPIIGELRILPGGAFGFNSDLDPQISTNYELGLRGGFLERRVGFDVAVFRQNVKDFISPFGTSPNNSFQNVGDVKENGLELAASATLVPRLVLTTSYTYSDFVFTKFDNGVSNFAGNRLPGVPKHHVYGELRYQVPAGVFGAVESQYSGRFFTNDANQYTNPPYAVTNLRFGYEQAARARRLRLSPFLGINNLFDRKYSAFAIINDAARRFFNPLPARNVYGGLGITF